MAKYHVYVGVGNPNNQLSVGIWGNPVSDPCPTRLVSHPELLGKLTNNGRAFGTLRGTRPMFGSPVSSSCYNYFDGVVPPSKVTILRDTDSKSRASMKSFMAAVKAGKIVLRRREIFQAKVVQRPGVFLDASITYPSVTLEKSWNNMDLVWSPQARPTCSGSSTVRDLFIGIDGHPADVPMTGVPNGRLAGRLALKWDVLDVDVGDFSLPSVAPAHELMKLIESSLAAPWDRGLITKTISEANSGTIDLLTEIAELKETVGYVMGLLRSIVKLYVKTRRAAKNIVKKPGKSSASIADELASLWMQFRYAVMPVTYTIDDILATIADISGEYQSYRSGSETVTEVRLSDGWSCSADIKTIDRVFVKYRLDLDVALGKMKTNPFATAWELTPLSFVIDWVLNIGDLLSALHTPSEVVDSGFQYSRQIREITFVLQHPSHTGSVELTAGYYSAKPFTPIDHIGLSFDFDLTWKQWLDAISLSWGATRGLLKSK